MLKKRKNDMMIQGEKRASVKQKFDSLKTGKGYARLFIKKAKGKLKTEKNLVRDAAEIKHTRYCE